MTVFVNFLAENGCYKTYRQPSADIIVFRLYLTKKHNLNRKLSKSDIFISLLKDLIHQQTWRVT